MFAPRTVRRRIDDALAVASPLALAEAMDAHICSRSPEELHGLIERSIKRMDSGERRQLELYLNLEDADDLLGYRFSAFLRQNPRAIAALDPDAADAILAELGDVPPVAHPVRHLSARSAAFVGLVLAVAVLPLAAQYAHQRGLLQGLTDPLAPPPVITPFVESVSAKTARTPAVPRARARTRFIARRAAAPKPHAHHPVRVARSRWHHPRITDSSRFGERARISVRSYLGAIIAGDLRTALSHLGMPAGAGTGAISELPIITRRSAVAIVGSKPVGEREQVQADITTDGREYYEVFYVVRDGPATRIAERYFIPVNHRAQVALRLLVQNSH